MDPGLLHGRRRGSSDFRLIKTLRYRRPDLLHRILEVVTEAVIAYLNAQIAAGAQVVMIFDTWGGVLSDADFVACSQSYLARIVAGVADKGRVPVIVFTKGGGLWLERLADTGAAAVGVDWTVDLGGGSAADRRHAWRCRATSIRWR